MSDFNNFGSDAFDLNGSVEMVQETQFVTAPAGEYEYRLGEVNIGKYNPPVESGKTGCFTLKIKLSVQTPQGPASFTDTIFLRESTAWLLSAFLRSCGAVTPQDKSFSLTNAQHLAGMTGTAKIGIRTYMKDGEEKTTNEVKKWLPKGTAPQPPQAPVAPPAYAAPVAPVAPQAPQAPQNMPW